MKITHKISLFIIASCLWLAAVSVFFKPVSTLGRASAAVASAGNSDAAWLTQQGIESGARWPWIILPILAVGALLFRRDLFGRTKTVTPALMILVSLGLGGCIKPYNAPLFVDVSNNETAYVIPLQGDTAAQYILDELRARKNEMREEIQADVVPFFAERGITITTIGQFGGMTYENPDIQKSIDGTFVAQQQKVVAAALLSAQKDVNERLEQEKQQAKRNAILLAEGEAAAITLVADASQKAASNPAFVRLRELEVETKRVEKWNGVTPTTLIDGHSSGVSMFLPQAKQQ